MKVTVSRKAHFNAAHRLHVEDWSDDKNKTWLYTHGVFNSSLVHRQIFTHNSS